MKQILNLTILLAVLTATIACSGGGSEGGDVPKEVQTQYQNLGKAAQDAGGDFNKLSEADKQAFIQRAGNEVEARKMVGLMAGGKPQAGPRGK
jgi:hypothetical protein